MCDRIVRDSECERITALSRPTRWRLEKEGRFPKRRQIGKSAIGWLESELLAFITDPEGWVERNKAVAVSLNQQSVAA